MRPLAPKVDVMLVGWKVADQSVCLLSVVLNGRGSLSDMDPNPVPSCWSWWPETGFRCRFKSTDRLVYRNSLSLCLRPHVCKPPWGSASLPVEKPFDVTGGVARRNVTHRNAW